MIRFNPAGLKFLIILAAAFVFFTGCPDHEADLPGVLEISSPVGIPGAMAWHNGRLWIQELKNKDLYNLRFNPGKRKFDKKISWGQLCLESTEGLDRTAGGCEAALDLISTKEGLVALGPRNKVLIDVDEPWKVTEISKNEWESGKIIAMVGGDDGIYYLEDKAILKAGKKPGEEEFLKLTNPYLINPVGLVIHNRNFYTMLRGTGQLLSLRLDENKTLKKTGLSAPLITIPYDMAYGPKKKSLWISSPAGLSILRISLKSPPGPDMDVGTGAGQIPDTGEVKEIKTDTTWGPGSGEIKVKKTLRVARGVTLDILPGTRMVFSEGAGLIVTGKLIARGKIDRPVIFDSGAEGLWWEGVTVEAGGAVDLNLVHMTWARNAVKATDPSIFAISNSWIKKSPGDGLVVNVQSAWPETMTIKGNSLDEIGGVGIKITLPHIEGPLPEKAWVISGNTISHAASAMEIGPPITRSLMERIGQKTFPPFLNGNPLKIDISGNGIFRNRRGAINISGDERPYPLEVRVSENVVERGSYSGDGVKMEEVAVINFENNAVLHQRAGFHFQNSVVNLRPNSAVTPEIKITSNLFNHNQLGVLFFIRGQTVKYFRNSTRYRVYSLYPHPFHLGVPLEGAGRNRVVAEDNFKWEDEFSYFGRFPVSIEDVFYKIEGGFYAKESKSDAIIACTVLKGSLRAPGVGVLVDIRDMKGNSIKSVTGNASGRFVTAIPPGEYYIKAGKAAQWSRLNADPMNLNKCELTAP